MMVLLLMILTAWAVIAVCLGLAYAYWEAIEDKVLREMFARGISREMGTTISLGELRIRSTGVTVRELEVANDGNASFEAPYFARVGSLEVRTAGLVSLLSCGGTAKVGSTRYQFVFGFQYRDIDEVLVSGVSMFVEETTVDGEVRANNAFLAAQEEKLKARKKEKLRLEAKLAADFKAKWRCTEDDDAEDVVVGGEDEDEGFVSRLKKVGETLKATKGQGLSERRDALVALRDRFKTHDQETREAARISKRQNREQNSALWRIGRISVSDCGLATKGTRLHVDSWEYRGFIGDTQTLRRKVVLGVMQDMLAGVKDKIHDAVHSKVANFKSRFFPPLAAPGPPALHPRIPPKPHKPTTASF